ncbi:MAG TPA: 1,6-anhydro-N-acetylmuramyl-L-alanine amidase AmpD [bacterium]|nr:1,6-anhydro-N-acetylmuramyl-L-alanine amidase AmpD [bacterium]
MRDLNFPLEERLYNLYQERKVFASAHFLISRGGEILQLVPLKFQAWHAGPSTFKGIRSCNRFMVGIENIGKSGEPFTPFQYQANAKLCLWLMYTYGFDVSWITGHMDVAIPKGRKKDPGKDFRWDHLRKLIFEAGRAAVEQ